MKGKIQVPGESKDRIVKEASQRIEALQVGCVPTEQALTGVVAWLMEQDEVEEVKEFGKSDLTVRFVDGSQIGILLGRRRTYGLLAAPAPKEGEGGGPASEPGFYE